MIISMVDLSGFDGAGSGQPVSTKNGAPDERVAAK